MLIIYATREGQTEKVANQVAAHLRASQIETHVVDARDSSNVEMIDLQAFDRLIFGASMHAGGLEKELVRFVNEHRGQIESKARNFFLVLLSAATKDPEMREKTLADARKKLNDQIAVHFDDVEMIAGALMYSRYSLPVKWIMKRIARKAGEDTDTSKDYEYTDWTQVERYAARIADIS